MAEAEKKRKKVTITELNAKMARGEQIVQMAIYDYRSAVIADRVGIDILCVSDTGGMILFGHPDTTSVSVRRGHDAWPRPSTGARSTASGWWTCRTGASTSRRSRRSRTPAASATRRGAEVMKCEGNQHHAKHIEAIVKAGIPVQGHIGITPMRMPQLGGFRAQGKTADRAKELVDDAWAMVDAGCFSIMCEVTTEEVCQYLAETLPGAGDLPGRRQQGATASTSSPATCSTSTRSTCLGTRRSIRT